MKFYISDLSLYFLAVVYVPLALWALWKLMRWSVLNLWWKKVLGLFAWLVLAYLIPLGDVTLNSLAMAKACKKAGLHVYRVQPVEGYLGGSDTVRSRTYRFLEAHSLSHPGKISHFELSAEGKVVRTLRDKPESEYEEIREYVSNPQNERLGTKRRWYIRNLVTGEVMGEWLIIDPRHGWVDRLTLNRWFGASLPGCDGDVLSKYTNWVSEIIPPKI